ncbi:MAG: hypothetical protein HY606_10725 [Planctomycetes bacterium]|nr:hypothetical protein [Planctomycetota bacterium]
MKQLLVFVVVIAGLIFFIAQKKHKNKGTSDIESPDKTASRSSEFESITENELQEYLASSDIERLIKRHNSNILVSAGAKLTALDKFIYELKEGSAIFNIPKEEIKTSLTVKTGCGDVVTNGTTFALTVLPLFKLTFLIVFSGQVEIKGIGFIELIDKEWVALFNNESLVYKVEISEISPANYAGILKKTFSDEAGGSLTTSDVHAASQQKHILEFEKVLSSINSKNTPDGKKPPGSVIKELSKLNWNEIRNLMTDLHAATPKSDASALLKFVAVSIDVEKVVGVPWGESVFLLLVMNEIISNNTLGEKEKTVIMETLTKQIEELAKTPNDFDNMFEDRAYYYSKVESIMKSYSHLTDPELLNVHKFSKARGSNLSPDGKMFTWKSIIINLILKASSEFDYTGLSEEQIIKASPYIEKLTSDISSANDREMIYTYGVEFIRSLSQYLTKEQINERLKKNRFMVDFVENLWIKTKQNTK